MKIIVRPDVNVAKEIDVTERQVAFIAEELWRLYGGDCAKAERHLRGIVAEARAEAGNFLLVARPEADRARSVSEWDGFSRSRGKDTGRRRFLLAALPARCMEECAAAGAAAGRAQPVREWDGFSRSRGKDSGRRRFLLDALPAA